MAIRTNMTERQRNSAIYIYCKAKDHNLRNVISKEQAEKLCSVYKVSLAGFEIYPDNTVSLIKLSYHIAKSIGR